MPKRDQYLSGLIAFAAIIVTTPVLAQVEPGATGGAATDNDTQMMTPAPVSGEAYPTTFSSNARSNYLSLGVSANGAYVNNVLPGSTTTPVNDATFSIAPTLTLSRSTPRQHTDLSYSPSFLLYEPTTALNTINQGGSVAVAYRFSEQVSVSLEDYFYRTSNVFDQSYTFSNGGIAGSTQAPTTTVIAPFATQLANTVHGILSYQFGRDGMVGGGGSYSITNFPNPANSSGLSNSNATGASAFYNRRLSRAQYFGLEYEYGHITTNGLNSQSTIDTHSLLPFYTRYLTRAISFSVVAGIEHTDVTLTQSPETQSWSPSVEASMGWRSSRVAFAANYAHTITSGGGLLGAFNSNGGGGTFTCRLTSNWSGAASANFVRTSDVSPQTVAYAGGTTITGQASLSRAIGEHFNVEFGYQRLHQDYSGLAVISHNPDSDEGFGRISYQFRKPLGR